MQIEMRNVADRHHYRSMGTRELRDNFLLDGLFMPDEIKLYYVDLDRLVIGSIVPLSRPIQLETDPDVVSGAYFTERRELGVFNIGAEGVVAVDGHKYILKNKDAIYIGQGHREIAFESERAVSPAKFYLASYPAHASHPMARISPSDHEPYRWGDRKHCNQRTLYQCINPKTASSCQLTMGCTVLDEGCNWNTFPAHVHSARSEAYLYFDLANDARVFHLVGEPGETRHLVVKNEEVALVPSWSVHSGVGTQSYSFVWAMGGENKDILSVVDVPTSGLR